MGPSRIFLTTTSSTKMIPPTLSILSFQLSWPFNCRIFVLVHIKSKPKWAIETFLTFSNSQKIAQTASSYALLESVLLILKIIPTSKSKSNISNSMCMAIFRSKCYCNWEIRQPWAVRLANQWAYWWRQREVIISLLINCSAPSHCNHTLNESSKANCLIGRKVEVSSNRSRAIATISGRSMTLAQRRAPWSRTKYRHKSNQDPL